MIRQRHINYHDTDPEWVAEFEKQLDLLCGCVIEMMDENKVLLLSPVMRDLCKKQAQTVKDMHAKVRHKLCVDNLHEPLATTP